ncbi:MAG: hypothetical protein JKX84_05105 [Flavobacteriales bacterium]|nr:hypothetical protein [Flavobacteriales bacterium]
MRQPMSLSSLMFAENKNMNVNTKYARISEYYSLENFIAENPESSIEKVVWFVTAQNQKKVLVIKSDIGNGGTHLLKGLGKELLSRKVGVVLLNGAEILDAYESKANFERYLATCEYCLIGTLSYARFKTNDWNWLQGILVNFIQNGGKIGFTERMDMTVKRASNVFETSKILEVCLHYPSQNILRQIVKNVIPDNIIKLYSDEAFLRSSTVSEYCAHLVIRHRLKSILSDDTDLSEDEQKPPH